MADINRQIEHESAVESFDERRINQVKAQLVQLERQIVILTRATANYKQKLDSAEGGIQQVLNVLRNKVEQKTNPGNITLSRAEVLDQIKMFEHILERLSSASQSHDTPWVVDAFTPNVSFLKSSHTPTLGEISSGNTKHVNLVQVTKLEQRLSTLHGDLSAFLFRQQNLHSAGGSKDNIESNFKLLKGLQSACEDLLQLSFLVPNVPWATRSCLPEVTADDLMKALPKLVYSKHQDVKNLITTALKLSDYRYSMLQNKNKGLELELTHLNSSDARTLSHSKSVSRGLLAEFDTYHQSVVDTLVAPLKGILDSFTELSISPTDDNLKHFLSEFKERGPQIARVCNTIGDHDMTDADIDLLDSNHEKQLLKTLKKLKLKKIELEDNENELQRLEHETRDELEYRVSQLSVKSSNPESSHVTDKQTKAASSSTVQSSAAVSFLSKYDSVEKCLGVSPSKSSKQKLKPSQLTQPVWLQEMKNELSTKPVARLDDSSEKPETSRRTKR